MAVKIVMPQLGESIAEGTITQWLKNVGDEIKQDENVLLISTDKVEAEIPSPAAGILLERLFEANETVAVGTTIGWVGQASELKSAAPKAPVANVEKVAVPAAVVAPVVVQAPAMPQAASMIASLPSSSSANQFLSPLVRRIAQEHQIADAEIFQIKGNGHDGRVTKKDLLGYLENRKSSPTSVSTQHGSVAAAPSLINFPPGQKEHIVPMSNMRRVIMENMINSRQTNVHVTTFFEIDYTKIDQIRQAHQKQFKEQEGVSLTYTAFLAVAVCQVLKRHPYINAQIRGDKIVFNQDVNLGIAVSISGVEPGLMVPVIKNCDQINLRGIARSLYDLSTRTRTKKIKPDELNGGTFTITNPGNYGAIIGTPIINQPQAAILGVGRIAKQPAVITVDGMDSIGVRNRGMLALSFDHRLIDGATADMFMADLKQTLENWTAQP